MTTPYLGELVPFVYGDSSEVRTVEHDDQIWFVANDVCAILGLKNPTLAAQRLDSDEYTQATVETRGGKQTMLVINEPGIYHLLLTSRLPQAATLRRWLTHDVIPAIRHTGRYLTPDAKQEVAAKVYRISEILTEIPTASATRVGHLTDELRLRMLDELLVPMATPEICREVAARHGIPAIRD